MEFLHTSAVKRRWYVVRLILVFLLIVSLTGTAGWFYVHQPPDPKHVTTLKDNEVGSLRYCVKNTSTTGGGLWIDPARDGHLTISSSIVAANRAPDGVDISGALISEGYNLIKNIAGAKGLNGRTDRQVTLADLKIDPTPSNNGGLTKTLALLPGSPAIDAVPRQACSITVIDAPGHTVTINTDQRDMKRPDENENRCDIGAYEI